MAKKWKTISGWCCKPGLPLSDVLKKWISLNEHIADQWAPRNDVPWWYNERASVSVFAGAVWLSDTDNIAFEEYVAEKRKRHPKNKRSYKGRVDLYFKVGSDEFVAETKQQKCWPNERQGHSVSKVRDYLSKACADIRKLEPEDGQRRLGMLFMIPAIERKRSRALISLIESWSKKIQQEIDCCDALAWVFPSAAGETKRNCYPGVALFIKEVRR